MAMVSSSDLRAMMKGVWETYRLRRVRIGESLFRWDPDRGAVAYEDAGGFGLRGGGPPKAGQAKSRAPIRTVAALRGEIEGSLYKSLIRAGGSAALAVTFAEVFRWSVDFRADVRRGDVFSVVAEHWATKGGRLRWGRILAAELRTRSGTYRAVAFPSRNGRLRYYNAEGKPLRRYFLRTPLNYTRISPGYSLRRFHPILKIHRPHRGIDYAAPAGTPVRAAADGVVAMARWAGEGGKTVRISHPGGFSTVYHHLSRYGRGIRRPEHGAPP
ncbi:MAG: M23 family metallopeptidase [Nitrospinota bacterium]